MQVVIVICRQIRREIFGRACEGTQFFQHWLARRVSRQEPLAHLLLLLRGDFLDGGFNFCNRAHGKKMPYQNIFGKLT